MDRKRSIINFNHIDKNLNEATLKTIKSLYEFYHKKWWCYKKQFRTLKNMSLACKMGSTALIVGGTIAGGVTLNPVVLGTISGAGMLLKTFSEYKKFDKKIEMCRYAFTTYEKVLTDLRSHLRGKPFDMDEFVSQMVLIDQTVTDLCPTIKLKTEKKYESKYKKTKTGGHQNLS